MPHHALRLLRESLHALRAVLPLRTLYWVTTRDLWITAAVGAPLHLTGRLESRHLYQCLETEDPLVPMIDAHHRALRHGETVEFTHERAGRRWDASVGPVRDEADRIVGCVGRAILQVTEAAPLAAAAPVVSLIACPDNAFDERAGDFVWERPGESALLQRILPAGRVREMRAQGRLVALTQPSRSAVGPSPVTTSPVTPAFSGASAGWPRRRRRSAGAPAAPPRSGTSLVLVREG